MMRESKNQRASPPHLAFSPCRLWTYAMQACTD